MKIIQRRAHLSGHVAYVLEGDEGEGRYFRLLVDDTTMNARDLARANYVGTYKSEEAAREAADHYIESIGHSSTDWDGAWRRPADSANLPWPLKPEA